jgi:hypothetical protein
MRLRSSRSRASSSFPTRSFLLLVLADEVSRRDSNAVALPAQKARLDPPMRLKRWDDTARVTFDRALLRQLGTLRFLDQHEHVALTAVSLARTDRLLKTLRHARLDHTVEAERRRLIAVDLVVLARKSSVMSRLSVRIHGVEPEGHRDRFTRNACDHVLDGESYRQRLKPGRDRAQPTEGQRPTGSGRGTAPRCRVATRSPWRSQLGHGRGPPRFSETRICDGESSCP